MNIDKWIIEEVINTLHQANNVLLGITGLDSEKEIKEKTKNKNAINRRIDKVIILLNDSIKVPKDIGEMSDGYHTFNELYEYRMLYNAALFNEFAKQGLYDVHKSRKHSNRQYPFDNPNWFIVIAELPTGQISNHYEMKDWDKFNIPEKELANEYDGHSPRDVADRLTNFCK